MCKECHKTFVQRSHLNEHEKIHRKEKSYECRICNQKFTQSNQLDAHKKTKKHIRRTGNQNVDRHKIF